MRIYNYSEARENFSAVLNTAITMDEILEAIKQRYIAAGFIVIKAKAS
jgi:hypothetical protein